MRPVCPPLRFPGRDHHRRASRDGGQSIVEAAIIMPAMVFLVLTIMQLTMVQHARIMTDYAAFCAARAGIVFNADPNAMQRAATIALLPTMGRTDTLGAVTRTVATSLTRETAERIPVQLPVVEVEVLSPKPTDFTRANSGHLNGAEIDFDDIRESVSEANLLQIRVRYYYHMKIPFANQILQTLFFAQKGNAWALWKRTGLSTVNPAMLGAGEHQISRALFVASGRQLVPEAGKLVAAAQVLKKFYFPLQATYSMRMQSNPYLSNVRTATGQTGGGP